MENRRGFASVFLGFSFLFTEVLHGQALNPPSEISKTQKVFQGNYFHHGLEGTLDPTGNVFFLKTDSGNFRLKRIAPPRNGALGQFMEEDGKDLLSSRINLVLVETKTGAQIMPLKLELWPLLTCRSTDSVPLVAKLEVHASLRKRSAENLEVVVKLFAHTSADSIKIVYDEGVWTDVSPRKIADASQRLLINQAISFKDGSIEPVSLPNQWRFRVKNIEEPLECESHLR